MGMMAFAPSWAKFPTWFGFAAGSGHRRLRVISRFIPGNQALFILPA
jgi:hypothetical protein